MSVAAREVDELFEVTGRRSKNRVSQVPAFARFILWEEMSQDDTATDFERVGEKLAQDRDFAHLAEDEVAHIKMCDFFAVVS